MRGLVTLAAFCALAFSQEASAGRYFETTDKLTDQVEPNAVLNEGGRINPMITCEDGKLFILLLSSEFLGDSKPGTREMSVRFDNEPAINIRVKYADEAAVLRKPLTHKSEREIFEGFSKSKRVFIRLWTYRNQPIEDDFELGNAPDVIGRVLSNCQ